MFKFGFHRRRILVVGGEGFIGSRLLNDGFGIMVEKWESFDLKIGQDVTLGIAGDWDVIIFLACNFGQTPEAYEYNREMYEALDWYMRSHPNTHVIYTSSAAVYPDSKVPSSELTMPRAVRYYDKSKLLGELYVQQYRNHTILRLANVFGGGEGHGVIDQFISGKNTIHGDGEAVRDYVPVGLVVLAITMAIDDRVAWRGITNISSGRGQTVNEIWDSIGIGKPHYLPSRSMGTRSSILDNTKMKRLMGGYND